MKNLYVRKDGKDTLLSENVEIVEIGTIAEKQFGQLLPVASQTAYHLFTSELLITKTDQKYYILDGDEKTWVEPLEWMSHFQSVDNPDNKFFIQILKSANQSENQ